MMKPKPTPTPTKQPLTKAETCSAFNCLYNDNGAANCKEPWRCQIDADGVCEGLRIRKPHTQKARA